MASSTRLARLSICALLALPFGGCPYSSEEALFPAETAVLDASLKGPWRCISSHDDKSWRLTFTPFDTHQYVWTMESPGETLGVGRAHLGKLGQGTFLSALILAGEDVGGDEKPSWSLLRYTIVEGDLLRLRFVTDKPLDDAKTPAAARALLEKNVATQEFYEEGWVCVRLAK